MLLVIRPSRGKAVPQAAFVEHRTEVWVSDALRSQRGHAERWQMCLAHLLRDTQYAVDCGDISFAVPLKRLLLRTMLIDRRSPDPKDTTLAQYLGDLNRRLDRIIAERPSVIFRKVTNGFRSEWRAATYAAFRSDVSTTKLTRHVVRESIREALKENTTYMPGC